MNPLTRRWRQLGTALAHRRVDGRIPQATGELLHSWMRLRGRHLLNSAAAILRRPWARRSGEVQMSQGQWWETGGTPPCSLHDLKHHLAGRVIGALTGRGLHPFLVEASDSCLGFGLRVEDRPAAWLALEHLGREPGWYLDWRRGYRTGTQRLKGGRSSASVSGSEWWRIYRVYRTGYRSVAGRDQAVELSFWALGPSGELERVGVRGHQRFPVGTSSTVESVDGRIYPGVASYPVGNSLTRLREPIDAVYTWVDGSDPSWRASLDKWAPEVGDDASVDIEPVESLYRSRDELRYSLRSLWLHAGWIRRVFIVTAGQVPDWLVQDDRLTVVDHSEIFPAAWLPTFNSHAIEVRLHHIDGLSEHFLYFNDDVFLGRPVAAEKFFTANGLSRFFEAEARIPMPDAETARLPVNTAAHNGQHLIYENFGRVVDRKLHHAPHPLRRSVLFEIEARFPEIIEKTARSRFRNPGDLSVASAFAHHYAFCTGRAIPGTIEAGYQNLEARRLSMFLERVLLARDLDVFCLNDTEVPNQDPERTETALLRFLDSYFPVSSPWEKRD